MTDILERTVNLSEVAETKAEREYYYDVAEEISNLRAIKSELRAALKLVRSVRMLDNLTSDQFAAIDAAIAKAEGSP